MDFSGKTAVVTGAGTGVGRCIALALAKAGARCVLAGRRAGPIDVVAREIAAAGGEAEAAACDVSDAESVAKLAAMAGPAAVVVNNAGVHGQMVPISESEPECWLRTMHINLLGPYLVARAFVNPMIEAGWGRIINVSSAAGLGDPGFVCSEYQLSKASLNFFTRQLAAELQGTGVTANAMHPGEVKSEMWARIREESERTQEQGGLGWAAMVDETGGDPPEKSGNLVLKIVAGETNGAFHWIEGGIQAPRETWPPLS